MGGGPLIGIRVVDLADESAIFATRLLADLGAEVVRVEPPEGDSVRRLAPFAGDKPGSDRSLTHAYLNAGKRSVVIDRTSAGGRQAFAGLVATADAIVETERLDDAVLRDSNPSLIHVTVTPFGLEGPWSDWQGNDLVCGAAGGLVWVCGSPDDPPTQPGGHQTYKMAGLTAATGVLFALRARDTQPGEPGVHIDISLQESAAMTVTQTSNPFHWVWNKHIPRRPGLTAVHKCADGGWITLMVRPDRLDVFCEWAEEAGLDVPDRAELADAFGGTAKVALLVRALAGKYTRDEFMKRAWAVDLIGLPVNSIPDLETCEQFVATQQFSEVDDDLLGPLPFPRSPVDPLAVPLRRAPRLGEHRPPVPDEGSGTLGPGPRANSTMALAQALAGVRVVDFCWVIAGPLGTRVLANFGAEVIRVEAGARAYPDTFPAEHRDPTLGAFHNNLNTQKKSITVDPRHPRGKELLLELIATADVVTNNYRPGALDEMGFGFDVLRAVNPRIINLQVPGCGSQGPWAQRGSFGNMVNAAAGVNAISGFPGRSPRGMGVAYPDFTSPYLMAILVAAALRERDRTGEPMDLELNQLSATVALVGVEWLHYATTGEAPPPSANRDPNWCPHGVYPAAGEDEWVALACRTDGSFARLCATMGSPELADDARFASHAARKQHEDELDGIITCWTSNRDKWTVAELLQAQHVAAAPVENLADAIDRDPQLHRHYQRVVQPSHPDVEIPVHSDPIQVAYHRRAVGRAPMYGEHNDDVLGRILGLSGQAIDELRAAGVVH